MRAPLPEFSDKWIAFFMAEAELVAMRSKDPSTKVGAVAVDADFNTICNGYNGLPRGVADLPERLERPEKYDWIIHAEANLVATAALAGRSLKGAAVFVTHYPCSGCAGLLAQAGVARIYAGPGLTSMEPRKFEIARIIFQEKNIEVIGGSP